MTDEERELLGLPVRALLDDGDKYPIEAEPHFLVEPPAPESGRSTSFVELPGTERAFRRLHRNRADPPPPRPGALAAEGGAVLDEPSWGVQVVAVVVGLLLRLSQGGLAGVCLLQLACTPWPDPASVDEGRGELLRPVMYAPIALPMHRVLQVLALLAFLAACDLHAASAQRGATVLLMALHAAVVVTLVLELPTSVALTRHRALEVDVEPLQALLDAVLSNNATVPPTPLYEPRGFAQLTYPAAAAADDDAASPFSTSLNAPQLGLWQGLMVARATIAGIAWLVACLIQSRPAFEVPPLSIEPLSGVATGSTTAVQYS